MKEIRRILGRRRLLLGLVLILLLNGFLFAREQIKNDYGLDVLLPQGGTIIINGNYTVTQESADAKAAYGRYLEWLDRVKNMPLADAAEMLAEQERTLSGQIGIGEENEDIRLDYVAVKKLLTQTDYLTGYGDWLANIQKNKDNLLTFSIFNDPNSFSSRNIIKTAEEFEKLEGVGLTLGADGAVDAFMTFPLTDYFLLVVLLLVALSFLEERKAGLWSVVHAAPNGRWKLAIRRTLILFALWAACQTDRFAGVAAVSPSVWFPGWLDYARTHPIRSRTVYLSLGDREEKAKNPRLATVGDSIRTQHALLLESGILSVLEWNPGNHFTSPPLRMAKALAWLEREEEKSR